MSAACCDECLVLVKCDCGRNYTIDTFRGLDLADMKMFDTDPKRLELRKCLCGELHHIWTDLDGAPVPMEKTT